MGDATQLRRLRGIWKGRLTAFENKFNQLAQSNTLSQRYLVNVSEQLPNIYSNYDKVQSQLETSHNDNGEDREQFMQRYDELQANIDENILRLDQAAEQVDRHRTVANVSNNSQASVVPRLPELKIPKFSGKRTDWLRFWNQFEPSIDQRADLSAVHKFQYLDQNIEGGVAQSIMASVTNSDYETAKSLLLAEYGNNQMLRFDFIKELYEAKPAKVRDAKALDNFVAHITVILSNLEKLEVSTSQWDLLLIYHLLQRLDPQTRSEWEKKLSEGTPCTKDAFIQFLKDTARLIERIGTINSPFNPKSTSTPNLPKPPKPQDKVQDNKIRSQVFSARKRMCNVCKGDHWASNCDTLQSLNVEDRHKKVFELGLCFNCLNTGHVLNNCTSPHKCKTCGLTHHTLLHRDSGATSKVQAKLAIDDQQVTDDTDQISEQLNNLTLSAVNTKSQVVLATAMIYVVDRYGNSVLAKAFLDCGSTSSFITTEFNAKLHLPRQRVDATVDGINGTETLNKYQVSTTIKSRVTSYSQQIDLLVTRKIADLPRTSIDAANIQNNVNCKLADPTFNESSNIQILLGADVFFEIFNGEKQKLNDNLWLYPTLLGGIIAGKVNVTDRRVTYLAIDHLKSQIQRFWELEHLSTNAAHSTEELIAEKKYVESVVHRPDNHYQVSLPTTSKIDQLCDTQRSSKHIFLTTEERLLRSPNRHFHYCEFMKEMIDMGHMEQVDMSTLVWPYYFFIHHMVTRPSSTTTKYRVVFNGSFKSDSGLSLNDILLVGPTIQNDLFSHLLRWREQAVALTSDITKMYRMIYIDPNDQKLQLVWWRFNPNDPLQVYKLTTVTYGTASAPFQAIRTLFQLSDDLRDEYPDVAENFKSNFYVDDYVSSHQNESVATNVKRKMIDMALKGGFTLRKWNSNVKSLSDNDDEITTVLGVSWNKVTDEIILGFEIKIHNKITKASVLSEIAQLSDPLGLCAPVVLKAKLFMQKLWTIPLEWDDTVDTDFATEWKTFRDNLLANNKFNVPRPMLNSSLQFEIHGFCDASDQGYGACIYIVVDDQARLLCAKSKIAPLKTLTTPRLELCAALLLSNLVQRVTDAFVNKPSAIHLWSDSEVTLFRIMSHPAKFNIFVASRIAEIQQISTKIGAQWMFVPTLQNSSDVLSRGCDLSDLINLHHWWNGPSFIIENVNKWPDQSKFLRKLQKNNIIGNFADEMKNYVVSVAAQVRKFDDFILNASKFQRLINGVAYCLRFLMHSKKGKVFRDFDPINAQEKIEAELRLIRIVQQQHFSEEFKLISDTKPVQLKSKLKFLNPFIDEDGIIRVGGRLKMADINYDQQHQIVLPKCWFTKLLLTYLHEKNFHCGSAMLLNISRQRYWILQGRSQAKNVIHSCIPCFRHRPILRHQIMGNLPSTRVNRARPFEVTGIDFCGYFWIRPMPRAKTLTKAYVSVFTCFVTRACFLEVVPDLSTKSFLNALRRFVASCGIPKKIFTDNGTNFVGAKNYLQELKEFFLTDENVTAIKEWCAENLIHWQMIPARSPHFGGVWESIVKIFKHHLKRFTSEEVFAPDNFCTLVKQVQCMLNSRPLTPLSDDVNDLRCLTPGHFLIGQPMNSLPEPNYLDVNYNRLEAWQQIQCLVNKIWKQFSHDYLHLLQQRFK